jgi:putative transposase
MTELCTSERRACRALGQHRSTQRKIPTTPGDEVALTADIIELARQYGRYGYRRITALLRRAGWTVNKKRVERIWRSEGLKVPAKQPKRGRLWLNDGSCIRLRPERPNHVWSYDFVADRTHDGKAFRMLCIIDEFSRESLAIRVARKLKATDVIETLCELFVSRGIPTHIRPITARSLSPRRSGIGSPPLEPGPLTSSGAVRGRTAIARASTESCAMSCSTVKSSTH